MTQQGTQRWRFDRRGNVIRDERRMSSLYGTDAYMKGDPLFAPRRSSRARKQWQAKHNRSTAAYRARVA